MSIPRRTNIPADPRAPGPRRLRRRLHPPYGSWRIPSGGSRTMVTIPSGKRPSSNASRVAVWVTTALVCQDASCKEGRVSKSRGPMCGLSCLAPSRDLRPSWWPIRVRFLCGAPRGPFAGRSRSVACSPTCGLVGRRRRPQVRAGVLLGSAVALVSSVLCVGLSYRARPYFCHQRPLRECAEWTLECPSAVSVQPCRGTCAVPPTSWSGRRQACVRSVGSVAPPRARRRQRRRRLRRSIGEEVGRELSTSPAVGGAPVRPACARSPWLPRHPHAADPFRKRPVRTSTGGAMGGSCVDRPQFRAAVAWDAVRATWKARRVCRR